MPKFPLIPFVPKPEPTSSYFKVKLALQPTKIVTAGVTDTQGFFLGIFSEKLKIVVDLNGETKALAIDYNRIMINLTLLPASTSSTISKPANTTVPLVLLQPVLQAQGWVGETEFGGIVTDAPPGDYHIKVELIDMTMIFNGQASTAILGTLVSKGVKLV
ncbi:uncharacterized protein I303_100312 [Kwoniella dejecticola CBS 10117]|uniref:Uncharacterized protein n=1 Tax=Kwoniella dejecticola CBS 10117 TaxID=1296121 RepID=A0A1A6AEK2_9TREE|nr:uncharacterized protein I303_00312 [Kwoniella dejecticola CBS 10117]OBR88495.1 hypothetical protein I303_00312 [Kwoniella dejecticola CBS 10117]